MLTWPARLICLLAAAAAAAGCVPPLLSARGGAPSQVLTYPGAPPVQDGRPRFRQILCALAEKRAADRAGPCDCEELLWRLPDEKKPAPAPAGLPAHAPRLRVLIVPGAFGECFPEFGWPFQEVAAEFAASGFRIDVVAVAGRSGADHNAGLIAAAVEQLPEESPEPIVLIGHSKGAVDILHFLANHPRAARRVRAVVSVAAPVGGSPLADMLAGIYDGLVARMPFSDCAPGDRQVVANLTRPFRMAWLAAHPLPGHVRYFSLGSMTGRENIHPLMLFPYDLLAAYEPRNDGFVVFSDQVIPGATLLGYANLDHWDVALHVRERLNIGGLNSRREARRLIFEALLLTLAESLSPQS